MTKSHTLAGAQLSLALQSQNSPSYVPLCSFSEWATKIKLDCHSTYKQVSLVCHPTYKQVSLDCHSTYKQARDCDLDCHTTYKQASLVFHSTFIQVGPLVTLHTNRLVWTVTLHTNRLVRYVPLHTDRLVWSVTLHIIPYTLSTQLMKPNYPTYKQVSPVCPPTS